MSSETFDAQQGQSTATTIPNPTQIESAAQVEFQDEHDSQSPSPQQQYNQQRPSDLSPEDFPSVQTPLLFTQFLNEILDTYESTMNAFTSIDAEQNCFISQEDLSKEITDRFGINDPSKHREIFIKLGHGAAQIDYDTFHAAFDEIIQDRRHQEYLLTQGDNLETMNDQEEQQLQSQINYDEEAEDEKVVRAARCNPHNDDMNTFTQPNKANRVVDKLFVTRPTESAAAADDDDSNQAGEQLAVNHEQGVDESSSAYSTLAKKLKQQSNFNDFVRSYNTFDLNSQHSSSSSQQQQQPVSSSRQPKSIQRNLLLDSFDADRSGFWEKQSGKKAVEQSNGTMNQLEVPSSYNESPKLSPQQRLNQYRNAFKQSEESRRVLRASQTSLKQGSPSVVTGGSDKYSTTVNKKASASSGFNATSALFQGLLGTNKSASNTSSNWMNSGNSQKQTNIEAAPSIDQLLSAITLKSRGNGVATNFNSGGSTIRQPLFKVLSDSRQQPASTTSAFSKTSMRKEFSSLLSSFGATKTSQPQQLQQHNQSYQSVNSLAYQPLQSPYTSRTDETNRFGDILSHIDEVHSRKSLGNANVRSSATILSGSRNTQLSSPLIQQSVNSSIQSAVGWRKIARFSSNPQRLHTQL